MAPDTFAGLDTRQAMALVTRALDKAGIEGPGRDARLLFIAALGITGTDLFRTPERRLDCDEAERLARFVTRRIAREPVSRILGERGFYGRTFRVTPATLDPRPCTETVIEAALEIAEREGWRSRPIRILDVGTGSGILLVTLLAELPLATGVGTDVSEAALEAARGNAERLGVAPRATFLNRRSLGGIDGTFDVMVSNPPYIPTGDIGGLDPEVREFDPAGALDGGEDGLDIYREIAAGLPHSVPRGWAFLEVGAGQAKDVEKLFKTAGGEAVIGTRIWRDLGLHERCVAVQTQH
jgi:release factor glutamine methyltransferase